MKVLFVGYHNPNYITLTEYIENAILRLGHQLSTFDDRKYIVPKVIRENIPFLQDWDIKRINSNLLKQVKNFNPDLCLINSLYRTKPATVLKIKALGIKTGFMISDFPWNPEAIAIEAVNYDFVFYGGTEVEDILRAAKVKNAHWIPFGCDEQIHKPLSLTDREKHKYSCDIAFVGSISPEVYPQRLRLLEEISDLDLKVWGPGVNQIALNSPLKKNIQGEYVRPDEWLKIYAAAKIGLCIHFKDPKGQKPCHQASPRLYELMASKCFVLVDNQKDVGKMFEDGKHLVVFKDIDDLRNKINYYLKHEQQRQEIAKAGHLEVMDKHTYTHRLKQIFLIMKGE